MVKRKYPSGSLMKTRGACTQLKPDPVGPEYLLRLLKRFNVNIQSRLLQHTSVEGASSGRGQRFRSGQQQQTSDWEGREQCSRYDMRAEGALPLGMPIVITRLKMNPIEFAMLLRNVILNGLTEKIIKSTTMRI